MLDWVFWSAGWVWADGFISWSWLQQELLDVNHQFGAHHFTCEIRMGFFSVRFVLMEFHLWFYRPFFSPIRVSAALQPALISAVGIADILSRLWFFPYPLFQASWECSVQHSTAKGSWLSSSHVEIDHLSLPCRLLFSLLLALERAFPFILWLHSYLDVILCCGFITARSRRLSSRPCLLPAASCCRVRNRACQQAWLQMNPTNWNLMLI